MKSERWYEITESIDWKNGSPFIEKKAYIYDHPYVNKSRSVSIVNTSELSYYRNNFQLSKIWGQSC